MTIPIDEQKARKRAKKDEQIRDAYADAILKDLESSDALARRAAMKLHAESLIQRVEALQAELDALKQAAGNTADMDSAIAAKNAAEAELQRIKDNLESVLAEDAKKVRDAVLDESAAISVREVAVKKREDQLENGTNAHLTLLAFDFLGALVKRIASWTPTTFFDPEIPKSPWIWRIWFNEGKAKNWCAWEIEIAAKPRERQIGQIATELHAYSCIQHQREKYDLSPERREFLEARARYMDVENEVFEINRQMIEMCQQKPHPLPGNYDYEASLRANRIKQILTEGIPGPSGSDLLPEWLA